MNNDIMIDVVKKVFSTYQPGDMGLDLRDVIATQEEIVKILKADKWYYDDPPKSGNYIVERNSHYRYPVIIDFYNASSGDWSSSERDVVRWKPIYYGDIDEGKIIKYG